MHAYVHIVDDDASFRTTLERRLKLAGYRVATYASARQLLDQLPGDEDAGYIILNIHIPKVTSVNKLNFFIEILPSVIKIRYQKKLKHP